MQAGAATAAAAAGGAAAEIEHFRVDLPAGCSASGAAAETAEKLLHLLALLKLNLVQRKVSGGKARGALEVARGCRSRQGDAAAGRVACGGYAPAACAPPRPVPSAPPTPTPPQVLVFVNTAESGMRVRLFLEAFGVRSAVLNAELPLNSRHHILQASAGQRAVGSAAIAPCVAAGVCRAVAWRGVLRLAVRAATSTRASPSHGPCAVPLNCPCGVPQPQEFNKGLFDYLIATDDVHAPAVDGDDEQQQRKRKKGGGGGGGKKKASGRRGEGGRGNRGRGQACTLGVTLHLHMLHISAKYLTCTCMAPIVGCCTAPARTKSLE